MKEEEKLAADEAQRIAQHETVKGEVRGKVHADITRQADRHLPAEQRSTEALAASLERKAVHEVATTEAELERGHAVARASQVVDYLFYLVYGVIGLEIVLDAIGARQTAAFKQFVDAIASPLLLPFRGLMPDPSVGRFRLMVSYIVALIVYMLVHAAVNGLLRIFVHRKTVV
jgi:uncharacterized protein YggT (Ycf19 family)